MIFQHFTLFLRMKAYLLDESVYKNEYLGLIIRGWYTMELKECSVFLLAKTSQAGYKFWANYIADQNVTTVQAMFLILLTSEDGQTSGRLGAYSKLDSATVSGVIDRLQTLKLVKRKPSPTDRRSSLIFLEPEGVKKGLILTKRFETAHHEFLSSFTEEEKSLLKSLLGRLLTEHSELL